MRGIGYGFFESLARLFSLKDWRSFCEHGVQRLHVIIGEVAQRLIGGGMHHALLQGGVDAHAQQLFGQTHGLGRSAGDFCGYFQGLGQ